MVLFSIRKMVVGTLSRPRPSNKVPGDHAERSRNNHWSYTSELHIPETLLEGAGVRFRQDNLLDNGLLRTEYNYQSAVFHEATIYSNGTSHVSLFDRRGKRVPDFSYVKYDRAIPTTLKLEPVYSLAGTTLSLYGNVENATGNIGHWMIDGLSRLFLALKNHSLDEIDHVLVPKLKYEFQRQSINSLGITNQKIVEIDALECVFCERIIVTTAPRGFSSSNTPGWIVDGYRQSLLSTQGTAQVRKRIYISRRDAGSRKFVNEEAIIECLEGFGFEAIEMSSYDFGEKVALFANADVVVGLTGAGLTNVLFCRSDAIVLELFPDSFVTYFYASMCAYLGLNYHSIIFENDSLLSNVNQYYGDLFLDTDILSDKVQKILH